MKIHLNGMIFHSCQLLRHSSWDTKVEYRSRSSGNRGWQIVHRHVWCHNVGTAIYDSCPTGLLGETHIWLIYPHMHWMYMYLCIHTYMHACIHASIHTRRTCIHAYMHTYKYNTILYYPVLLYYTILYYTILHNTILYNTILYYTSIHPCMHTFIHT